MSTTATMLKDNKNLAKMEPKTISECVDSCFSCGKTCDACADACMGEENLQKLVECVRLDMTCSDICIATGRVLVRPTPSDTSAVRHQLQSCARICEICADECDKHASIHEHCRICAEECRQCKDHCDRLLAALDGST